MKMRSRSISTRVATCLVAVGCSWTPQAALAQGPPVAGAGRLVADAPPNAQNLPAEQNPLFGYRVRMGKNVNGAEVQYVAQMDSRSMAIRKLDVMKEELKQAVARRNEDDVADATDKVKTSLGDYFDRDMEFRRAELDRLTERADDTEARNERRQSSRAELIDLQLQAYVHEAQGLGLFGEQPSQQEYVGGLMVGQPAPGMIPAGRGTSRSSGMTGSLRVPGVPAGAPVPELLGIVSELNSAAATVRGEADPRAAAMLRIGKARASLSAAEDNAAEAKARGELEAALGDYFDRDMEVRRAEMEQVRKSLNGMQTRLQTRADSRSAIIELQLKMIVNEAEGLGFYSGSDGTPTRSRGSSSGSNPFGVAR